MARAAARRRQQGRRHRWSDGRSERAAAAIWRRSACRQVAHLGRRHRILFCEKKLQFENALCERSHARCTSETHGCECRESSRAGRWRESEGAQAASVLSYGEELGPSISTWKYRKLSAYGVAEMPGAAFRHTKRASGTIAQAGAAAAAAAPPPPSLCCEGKHAPGSVSRR